MAGGGAMNGSDAKTGTVCHLDRFLKERVPQDERRGPAPRPFHSASGKQFGCAQAAVLFKRATA